MQEMDSRVSVLEQSKSVLVKTRSGMPYVERGPTQSSERGANLDFESVTNYFIGFWRASNVAQAMRTLERYESKRMQTPLCKKYGQWCPPPEVAQALKTHHQPLNGSHLPNTKEARNLKFVLKMLGCSLHENRPYRQLLKAKTIRQKRLWMYKYMSLYDQYQQVQDYSEPICPTRLKRLYQFFPDRFKEENDSIYFNDKVVTYDGSRRVFYFGVTPTPSREESE